MDFKRVWKNACNTARSAFGLDMEPGDMHDAMLRPCEVLRPARNEEPRTIVVLGMPRGGTSMVAGVLSLLGFNIGDDVEQSNQEDQEFTRLAAELEPLYDSAGAPIKEKFDKLRALVAKKNEARPVWAFKDPNAHVYINELMPVLRNPYFVLVFRDHFAAAQTIHARTGQDYIASLEQSFDQMKFLVGFMKVYDAPVLFASYERALRLRESFARQLAAFAGAEPDDATMKDILRYIRPDRGGGNLDKVYRAADKAFWRGQEVKRPGD